MTPKNEGPEAGAGCRPAPVSQEAYNVPNHRIAARTLIDIETLRSSAFKTRAVKDKYFVHPRIWDFHKSFMTEMASRQIPWLPFEIYRSPARQERLKAAGRSKAGAGDSPHQYGCAVDFVHGSRFWDLTKEEWDLVGVIGKEHARKLSIKITWGGDWRFYDPAHWELTDWREQNRARVELGLESSWPTMENRSLGALDELAKAYSKR